MWLWLPNWTAWLLSNGKPSRTRGRQMTQSDMRLLLFVTLALIQQHKDQWKCHHCCPGDKEWFPDFGCAVFWEKWAESGMFGGQSAHSLLAERRRKGVEAPCQLLTTRRVSWEKSCPLADWTLDIKWSMLLWDSKERLGLLKFLRELKGGSVVMHPSGNATQT